MFALARLSITFLSLSVFLLPLAEAISQERPVIKKGDYFPEIPLESPMDSKHRVYLGIGEGKSFTIADIKADFVLVEIMHINCSSCQRQAPINNKLYSLIKSTPETKGRVKMLAIAVGCQNVYIKQFTDHFDTPYPVVQDPKFAVYDAIGRSPTPLAIFVRRDPQRKASIVADTHLGFEPDYKGTFKQIQELMDMNLGTIVAEGKKTEAQVVVIKPIIDEKALQGKIKAAFEKEGEEVIELTKMNLQSGRNVYTGVVQKDEQSKRLFAVIVSRPPPCDVCHDVHFIYLFDVTGKIIQFIPLQLTKYGNEDWDDIDIEKMRKRVIGRYINMPFDYDPEIDAVTSATITSSVIFDSLDEGQSLFREIKEKDLL